MPPPLQIKPKAPPTKLKRKKTEVPKEVGDQPIRGAAFQGKIDKSPEAVRKRLALAADPERAAKEQSVVPGWTYEKGINQGQSVTKALDQLTRPAKAIAGVASEVGKGHGLKGVAHGFTEGLIKNKRYNWGRNLKDWGVKNNTLASVLGTGLDIGLDPTTYVTAGVGGGLKAGKVVNDLAKVVGKTAVKDAAEQGAKQLVRKAPPPKGLALKFGDKEVPGLGKVTAKVTSPIQKQYHAAMRSKPGVGARETLGEFSPRTTQGPMTRTETNQLTRSLRTHKATRDQARTHAAERGGKILSETGDKKKAQEFVDESVAASDKKGYEDLRQRAVQQHGIKGPAPKGYSHYRDTPTGFQKTNPEKSSVALPDDVAERTNKKYQEPFGDQGKAGKKFNAVSRGTAMAVRADPFFKMANWVGDLGIAAIRNPLWRLPRAYHDSNRVLKTQRKLSEARLTGKPLTYDPKIHVGGGKKMPASKVVDALEKTGGVNSGLRAGGLEEQAVGKVAKPLQGTKVRRVGRGIRRAGDWTENQARVMSNLAERRTAKGKKPWEESTEEATANAHVDYRENTPTETRTLRKIPFSQFPLRYPSVIARNVARRPGRLATYEKARQESAVRAGVTDRDWDKKLSSWEQLQAPFVLKKKKDGTARTISPGQNPVSELESLAAVGQLPSKGSGPLKEAGKHKLSSLAAPAYALPIAALTGFDLRSGKMIKSGFGKDLKPAPRSVQVLPSAVKKKLGVATIPDPRTGKRIEGLPASSDFWRRAAAPGGVGNVLEVAGAIAGKKNPSPTNPSLLGKAIGMRVQDTDPSTGAIERLSKQRKPLQDAYKKLDEQKRTDVDSVMQLKRLKRQLDTFDDQKRTLLKKRGDVHIPGAPKSQKEKVDDYLQNIKLQSKYGAELQKWKTEDFKNKLKQQR